MTLVKNCDSTVSKIQFKKGCYGSRYVHMATGRASSILEMLMANDSLWR